MTTLKVDELCIVVKTHQQIIPVSLEQLDEMIANQEMEIRGLEKEIAAWKVAREKLKTIIEGAKA